MNFSEYLIYTKSQLANFDQFDTIHVVLGNESCDLDSTISACLYAYFLYLTCLNKEKVLHVPLINNTPAIFRLRTEIHWLLKENFNQMIFIGDMNLNDLNSQKKLEITLVDHHYLSSDLNEAVVEIIDHHQIKENSISLKDPSAIQIETVGSCCTLIAEKILSANFQLTEEMAYLLSAPIIFDTVNFSAKVGKTTEKDLKIFDQLQKASSSPIGHDQLYAGLLESAADTTGLSIEDILQKDVKQIVGPHFRLVMSSLPMNYPVEKLLGELKTTNDLNEFLAKNGNADGVIITSIQTNNDVPKRQLAFYIKTVEDLQSLNSYFQKNDLDLDLHERSLAINQARIKFFDQNNIRLSRKQLLPFVENFVLNMKK